MAERHTFPQTNDADEAEDFGQMIGQPLLSDFASSGFSFNVDFTVPEVTVTTGVCFISVDSETTDASGETRLGVNRAIQLPEQTLPLTDNDTNYVYVVPNFGSSSDPQFSVFTSTVSSTSDSLLIGTIDTSNDEFVLENRGVSGGIANASILNALDLDDDVSLDFGTDNDFSLSYASSTDELALDDGSGNRMFDVSPGGPINLQTTLDVNDRIVDGGRIVWSSSNSYIPQTRLEQDSITLTASNGLTGGGSVSLGSSTTVDVSVSDIGGTFLQDDGNNNLDVLVGRGLEDDGTGVLQFDEDTSYTFTLDQTFAADVLDGSANVVYDQSNNWVPQARLENDSITLNSGNALTGGGAIPLGGSTTVDVDVTSLDGTFLSVDGSGLLQVDIGRGLEGDGNGAIQFDEDTSYTFTSSQTFEQNIDTTKITNQDYKEYYITNSTWGDISSASVNQTINSQDGTITGLSWNNNGTKLYEVGDSSNSIYEYDVSTAFDISTATFSQSINTQDSDPRGIAWNNDGTKLYEVGFSSDNIYEYDVSTPFDISTATFSQSINTQDSSAQGIAWNNDGTKLYEVGSSSDNIYEYNVSTAYDISTASFSQSINTQDSVPQGIAWNGDGTKLYEIGSVGDSIYEYTLSTPFDISTSTLNQSINTQDSLPFGITWNNGGTKLYECGASNNNIHEYTLPATHDISTNESNTHKIEIYDDYTFSFSGVDGDRGNSVIIRIVQDSVGGHTPTFNNVEWPGGSPPSWSTAPGAIDVATFAYDPDADVWHGMLAGNDMQ